MEQKYLLDTCTIIKYLGEVLPDEAISFLDGLVDKDSKISFITKIELLVWNPENPDDLKIREKFIEGSEVKFINDKIIDESIKIRKATNIKLPDAVIAATALCNELTLISTNCNDFNKVIPLGLKFLNPETSF